VSRTLIPSYTTSQTGSISISSSPSGADVYIDGSYRGITPVTLSDLTTGSHTIRISQSGYNDYSTKVTVYSGETAIVSRTLIPSYTTSQTGSISISSSPSRASVYVDGSYQGITPVTLSDLTTGSHTIRISQSGYNDYSATAAVYAWQTTTVTGILNPVTPVPTTSPTATGTAAPVPQTTGSFDPLSLIILLIVGLFVIVGGYFGYTQIMRSKEQKTPSLPDEPINILKMRYAKGELTTEEYLHMLENLRK
jgi:archaellum component FlaG (FlaF/FlaG flagellin family)